MTPEEQARLRIDQLLTDAGWTIQYCKQINCGASIIQEIFGKLGNDPAPMVHQQ